MTTLKITPPRSLSARQLEVLALVADGMTDSQIAEMLGLKLTTVFGHVQDLRYKLAAENRAHAVAIGMREGLIQ